MGVRIAFIDMMKLQFIFCLCLATLLNATLTLSQNTDFAPVEVHSLAWKPDGSQIAVAGGATTCGGNTSDYPILIVDTHTQSIITRLEGHSCTVETVAWSPDGTMLASASSDGQSIIWNTQSEEVITRLDSSSMLQREGITWSPNGEMVADFVAEINAVYIWNPLTGQILHTFVNTSNVTAVAWSPDSSQLAIGSLENEIQILDALSGDIVNNFDVDHVFSIDWSPDGTKLAIGGQTPSIIDAATGQALRSFTEAEGIITAIEWDYSGTRIASSNSTGNIYIWDADSGEQIAMYQHGNVVYALEWSPDNNQLAYGGRGIDYEINIVTVGRKSWHSAPTTLP